MTQALSRRTALGGAAALPIIAIAAATPANAKLSSSEWWSLKAEYDAAAALAEHLGQRHDTLFDEMKRQHAAIPHYTTKRTYETGVYWKGGIAERAHMTTEKQRHIAAARRFLQGLAECGSDLEEYAETCRELVAAAEAREAEQKRIGERLGFWKVNEQYEARCEVAYALEQRLHYMPAPDGPALYWKLTKVLATWEADNYSASYSADYLAPVLADAARLLNGEG